ncbi:MAG: hypothetical protein R3F39_10030 [Myxococcota bacterium]
MNCLPRAALAAAFALSACGGGSKSNQVCPPDTPCEDGICYGSQCLDPAGDPDDDGLINEVEVLIGTDPFDADSDHDGISDGVEVGDDPLSPLDSDADYVPGTNTLHDALESALKDGDGDCVADQFDAVDGSVLAQKVAEVCLLAGVCGDNQGLLRAVCQAGATAADEPVWVCVYGDVPGYSSGLDAACDRLDNDCDGATDEDFVAGGEGDGDCDGVDADCDGQTDEDFVSTATSCGEGQCAGSGALTCVGGALVDSCDSGVPSELDASCDGVDDDCNDATDEDFVPTSASCGVGACAAKGLVTCVGGKPVSQCVPGAAGADDASCDGDDDDCDGKTDEDYAPFATACGEGACAATGVLACVGGKLVDSCVAGAPSCGEQECGADGCGGSCGSCSEDQACVEGFCGCVPDCGGPGAGPPKCGDDGCGGTCALTCVSKLTCEVGTCDGGSCAFALAPGFCLIGGVCFADGAPNPANSCQSCDAKSATTGWTDVKNGSACADDGNSCTTEFCDDGECLHDPLPDYEACDDGDKATVGDWCHGAKCAGFRPQIEATYNASPTEAQGYSTVSAASGGGAQGTFTYKEGSQLAITAYGATLTEVTQNLGSYAAGIRVALSPGALVVGNTMWELESGQWVSGFGAQTLRSAWAAQCSEFCPQFHVLTSQQLGTVVLQGWEVLAAGVTFLGDAPLLRWCSRPGLCAVGAACWTCSVPSVKDKLEFGAAVAFYGGKPIVGANQGSESAPAFIDILTRNAAGVFLADPNLRLTAGGRRLVDMRVVKGSGEWAVGAGTGGLLFATKLDTTTEIAPKLQWKGVADWVSVSQADGRVFVLGSVVDSLVRHVAIAHASLATDITQPGNWRVHELLATATTTKAAPVLNGMAADSKRITILGSAVDAKSLVRGRGVWRWEAQ